MLVFPCQTGWRYSNRNPPNRGVECRWCGKKRNSERISLHILHTGLQCCKPYESRSVKNKVANVGKRRAEHSRRCPSPFFAQDEDELLVTGSTLYAADTTPLVITTFSAAVGHRKTKPGGYFCRKLTLTRTPDPIRRTNGRKQGGYDLGVFVRGVLVGHRQRQ